MTDTFASVRDIIVRDFELPPERLTRDTPLEAIELDSLALTELIFALEDEFHVTAEGPGEALRTLGDVADYVDQLIAQRDAGAPTQPARKKADTAAHATKPENSGTRKNRSVSSTRSREQTP